MNDSVKKTSRRAQLEKQGWKKQTTYDEPRLGELVAAYEEAGLDVRLEEPDQKTISECSACFAGGVGKLKTIYTREKKATGEQGTVEDWPLASLLGRRGPAVLSAGTTS
jgi:hypothetical protein